jgi:D-psicose/D-tagatose/L-ribulose 3-epimerase
MRYGVNAWVWTSPVTNDVLEELGPHVKELGFDWIEIPLESLDDMDHRHGGQFIRELGLGVSACAAVGPDRDLIHPDESIRRTARITFGRRLWRHKRWAPLI